MVAGRFSLQPHSALEINDANVAGNNYSLKTELNKKHEKVQVATLLPIIGEELSKRRVLNLHRLGERGKQTKNNACG